MRGLILGLALFAAGSMAHAQEAPEQSRSIAVDRFGPFQFGAGITQMRSAIDGDWNWAGSGRNIQRVNAGPLTITNQRFRASLTFVEDRLDSIALVRFEPTSDPAVCRTRLNTLLAALEAEIAPLTGERTVLEMGEPVEQTSTPGGSQVRVYRYAPTQAELSIASLAGSRDVRAWAYHGRMVQRQPGRRDIRCSVFLSIAPPAPAGAALPPPTRAELDAIALSSPPPFATELDDDIVRRFYPFMAYSSGVEGAVNLDCVVVEGGQLRCLAASTAPDGLGFDEGALRLSRALRVVPEHEGASTTGRRFGFRVSFRMPS